MENVMYFDCENMIRRKDIFIIFAEVS